MVFNLSGPDTLLLRWLISDVIWMKERVRRLAVRIRNRNCGNLNSACNTLETMVEQLDRQYEELFGFWNYIIYGLCGNR